MISCYNMYQLTRSEILKKMQAMRPRTSSKNRKNSTMTLRMKSSSRLSQRERVHIGREEDEEDMSDNHDPHED